MGWAGLFSVDYHSGGQLNDLSVADVRTDGNTIGLGYMVAWVHDQVCEISVVGEQQHSFAVLVQSSNRIDPLWNILDQLRYALSAQLVAHRCNIAARLMQHDVIFLAALLEINALSINGHNIAVRIDFLTQRGRTAVDLDFPLFDPFFRLASGHDALLGKNLLNSCTFFHS